MWHGVLAYYSSLLTTGLGDSRGNFSCIVDQHFYFLISTASPRHLFPFSPVPLIIPKPWALGGTSNPLHSLRIFFSNTQKACVSFVLSRSNCFYRRAGARGGALSKVFTRIAASPPFSCATYYSRMRQPKFLAAASIHWSAVCLMVDRSWLTVEEALRKQHAFRSFQISHTAKAKRVSAPFCLSPCHASAIGPTRLARTCHPHGMRLLREPLAWSTRPGASTSTRRRCGQWFRGLGRRGSSGRMRVAHVVSSYPRSSGVPGWQAIRRFWLEGGPMSSISWSIQGSSVRLWAAPGMLT
jgi:hypothetical protein